MKRQRFVVALSTLLVAAALMLAALGAYEANLQASAQRVLVTAVIALIAPLFWPGRAKTFERTAFRICAWSGAVSLLAALALCFLRGGVTNAIIPTVAVCAMLLLLLLVTHAVAAGFETLMATKAQGGEGAREMSGAIATVVLALFGSLPLWAGPAGELTQHANAATIDAAVALSPLVHLAVASGNDLLRNPWFYQHSNLAALRFSYPSPIAVTAAYTAIALVFVFGSLAVRRLGHLTDGTAFLTTERSR